MKHKSIQVYTWERNESKSTIGLIGYDENFRELLKEITLIKVLNVGQRMVWKGQVWTLGKMDMEIKNRSKVY